MSLLWMDWVGEKSCWGISAWVKFAVKVMASHATRPFVRPGIQGGLLVLAGLSMTTIGVVLSC